MHSTQWEKALRIAAQAHRHQMRKDSEIPYIYHPFAVAMLLQRFGYPEEWVIAGLLHDTVEDTNMTTGLIRQHFGDDIAELVLGCSEPDHGRKPWEHRKRAMIDYLRTAPYAVKAISCADKLHNLHSILADLQELGDAVWQKFSRGKDAQEWYYTSIADSLRANLRPEDDHSIFDAYDATLREVFAQ